MSTSSASSVYAAQTPHSITRLARSLQSGSAIRSGLVPSIGGDAFAEVFEMMATPAVEPPVATAPDQNPSSNRPDPAEPSRGSAEETSPSEDSQDEQAPAEPAVQAAADPEVALVDVQPEPALEDAAPDPAASDVPEAAGQPDAAVEEAEPQHRDASQKPAGDTTKTHTPANASGEGNPSEAPPNRQPSTADQAGQADLAGSAERTSQRTEKPAAVTRHAEGPAAPAAADAQQQHDSAEGEQSSSSETPEVRYAGEAGEDQGDRRSRNRGRSARDRGDQNPANQNAANPNPANQAPGVEARAAAVSPQRASAAAEAAAVVQDAANNAAALETAGEFQPPTAPAQHAAAAAAVKSQQTATAGGAAASAAAPAAANAPGADIGSATRDLLTAGPAETGTNRQGRSAAAETHAGEGPRVADRAVLIQRVSRAFQRMGVAGGQVRIRLHPEELGGVQLQMNVQGQKISASVVAETEAARSILTQHLPELRQRLADQGMQVERLEVHLQGEQDGQDASDLLRQDRGGQQGGFGRDGSGGWLGGRDPALGNFGQGRHRNTHSGQGRAGGRNRDAALGGSSATENRSSNAGLSVVEAAARKRVDLIG